MSLRVSDQHSCHFRTLSSPQSALQLLSIEASSAKQGELFTGDPEQGVWQPR